jgi:hypothetical protein
MTIYIEVLRNLSRGFWEIDTENKKALFRDREHKIPRGEKLHDQHEAYTTISDFLYENLKATHVKEIIPDTKYMYSDQMFCTWHTDGIVASDPNRKLHCTRPAEFYKNGNPCCRHHANVNF